MTGKDVDNFLDFCEAHLVSDPAERQREWPGNIVAAKMFMQRSALTSLL